MQILQVDETSARVMHKIPAMIKAFVRCGDILDWIFKLIGRTLVVGVEAGSTSTKHNY